MEHPKVIDLDYKERPWDYIEAKYGIAYRRAKVAEGELVYRLVAVREKTGHSSLITQLLDQNGRPIEGVPITFYWPTAPKPPDPPTTLYAHDWYDRFVWGITNINGEVGPGMGKGAYHGWGEGGPHKVWVHHPTIKSDIVENLGMLAGTFHDHCDLVLQLQASGKEEEEEEEPGLVFIERITESYGTATLGIAVPPDFAVAHDLRGDFRGPGVDDTLDPEEWFHPNGTRFAAVLGCCDFDGDEPREFTMRAVDIGAGGKALTDAIPETFEPRGAPRERIVYVFAVSEPEPPPEPEPEPPPPPPPPEWTMTVETKPGISLLIGKMPRAGIPVVVTDPRGPKVTVVSGSKAEHDVGGWEVNAWGRGIYTVEFEGQSFRIPVEGQTVIATFEEGEPPEPKARLVSTWMGREDAETMLQVLEEQFFPGVFSLES